MKSTHLRHIGLSSIHFGSLSIDSGRLVRTQAARVSSRDIGRNTSVMAATDLLSSHIANPSTVKPQHTSEGGEPDRRLS